MYILEGAVTEIAKMPITHYLFLFTDLLVWTQQINKKKFMYKRHTLLDRATAKAGELNSVVIITDEGEIKVHSNPLPYTPLPSLPFHSTPPHPFKFMNVEPETLAVFRFLPSRKKNRTNGLRTLKTKTTRHQQKLPSQNVQREVFSVR